MAIDIAQPMRFTVDLATGLTEQPQRAHLRYGDKNANRIVVTIKNGSADANLSGVSASGMFYRPPDGDEVPLTGSVNGNVVSVTLNDHCYTQEGSYAADVVLNIGGVTRTILTISGYVRRDGSGTLIDVDEAIVSIDEVLEKLKNLGTITDRAEAAANRVEQMQINAGGLAGDSNKLGGKPPEAYSAVNLLDNSNFGNLIAQAGLGVLSDDVYTSGKHGNTPYAADRWLNYACTAAQRNGFIRLTTPMRGRIYQKMENLAGKTITAAAKVKGSSLVYVGIYYTTSDGTTTGSIAKSVVAPDGVICVTGAIQSGATNVEFRIYPAYEDNGGYADIYWAALYEGAYTAETLPAYMPDKHSTELMECLRYFRLYATEAARPSNGLDCSPPMRLNNVSQGTVTMNGTTYYYNSADL